ncbi:hypothetical protein [Streptomyces sp. NPDC017940]|uniref:hypothetical protein n=1 Tax=Streptomyces sp. NPDC017940 TaxID=3365017 RepID=UPI00379A2E46
MNILYNTRLLSAGLLIAVLTMGATLAWPIWVWFLLPALCAGALLIDMRVPRPEEERSAWVPSPGTPAPERPAGNPYQEASVVVVPVESAVADCPFLFSANVWWRLADEGASWSHGNPAALASTSVLERVQRITSMEHPNRCTFLEHSMEGVLGMPGLDGKGLVVAFATDIRLVLRQKDREHLEELDGLRKAVDTWESRRQHERNVREYLGNDVLQSPGNAVVWWMARHDDQIGRAVEMIAPLTVLSAAANDEGIPEEYRDFLQRYGNAVEKETGGFDHPEAFGVGAVPGGDCNRPTAERSPSMSKHLSDWMESMGLDEGSAEGTAFLHRLAQMSDAAGRSEAAENIRRKMRGAGREEGSPAADPFEHSPPDVPVAADSANTPPPYEGGGDGYGTDEAQPPRPGGRQDTPQGQVSEANERTWWAPAGQGQEARGSVPEGSEQ